MGTANRIKGDHTINVEISFLTETMETNLEMDLSTIRMETGDTMENFFVHHRLKEETYHKITPITDQEVINLPILRSVDLTIDLRLKFPQSNNYTSSIVVRFTTIDDTINELSDLCPLNY